MLFEALRQELELMSKLLSNETRAFLLNFIQEKMGTCWKNDPTSIRLLECRLKGFCRNLKKKWSEGKSRHEYFLKTHGKWLNKNFNINVEATDVSTVVENPLDMNSDVEEQPGASSSVIKEHRGMDTDTTTDAAQKKRGRPQKPFSELAERAKQLRTSDLQRSILGEEIIHAAITTLNTQRSVCFSIFRFSLS